VGTLRFARPTHFSQMMTVSNGVTSGAHHDQSEIAPYIGA